jgi:hypothetical protein
MYGSIGQAMPILHFSYFRVSEIMQIGIALKAGLMLLVLIRLTTLNHDNV